MEFRLAQPGVLRRFEGRWQLTATASGGCELAIQQEVAPPACPVPAKQLRVLPGA